MDQRSQYLIQILEKIGAPLMGAIADSAARQGANPGPEAAAQDAQRMAELLSRSVQCSIEVGKSIDMANQPDQGESMRLALVALASGVIAGQYRTSGRTPAENDLKRIVTALQAVLTFSENFTPDPANIERLRQIQASGAAADPQQVTVQYLQAFVPVMNAIGSFSFGQPEQQAVQDAASRITKKAAELRTRLFPQAQGDTAKLAELALVRSLAALYASCHEAETTRLAKLSDDQRAAQSVSPAPVWAAFEMRAAMIEALAPAIAGNAGSGVSGSSGGKAPAPPPSAPPPPPVQQAPPPPVPPAAPQEGASPLSMFAKPDAAPPPAQEPPASPPPPPQDQQSGDNGGNPMSFFKKSG